MQIRSRQAADRPAVRAFLAEHGHARAARLGELVDPLDYPALISEAEDGRLLGVLTYIVDRDQCEILTLHTAEQWQGVGTALVEAVERLATRQGCRRLWLEPGQAAGTEPDRLVRQQTVGRRQALAARIEGAIARTQIGHVQGWGASARLHVQLRMPRGHVVVHQHDVAALAPE